MRRLLTLAAAIAIAGSCGALAQTGPTPGMGATSPLGSTNFNAPAGPLGIPLGSTELDGGGTSPLPGVAPCSVGTTAGMGSSATTGVFDGGGSSMASGMSGGSMGGNTMGSGTVGSGFDGGGTSTASGTGSSCVTSGTAASPTMPNTPGAGLQVPNTGSNTVPLGSVELANPGVSPMVGVPAPVTTPCGTSTTGGTSMSTGNMLNGC
jgi:hypothetical protein